MPACCARQQFVFRYCSSAGPYRRTGWLRDRTMTDSVRSNIWFRPDKFPCAAHSRSEDRETRVFSYSGWWYSRRVLQTDPFPYLMLRRGFPFSDSSDTGMFRGRKYSSRHSGRLMRRILKVRMACLPRHQARRYQARLLNHSWTGFTTRRSTRPSLV